MITRLNLLLFATLALAMGARANNIAVANVAITNQNVGSQSIFVKLDLAWENSWRLSTGPANWDAAWVFVKFHTGDGNWRHASLSTNSADHSVPVGAALDVGSTGTKGVGAFIYRSGNGSGTNNWPGINLKWMYGLDGVSNAALVTVDVSAIEMVYVPTGSFYVGDGSSSHRFTDGASAGPYLINSAGIITVTNTSGNLWATNNLLSLSGATNIPAAFPKGFNAFYCMKYEVSQGQYADYINKGGVNHYQSYPREIFSGSPPNYVATTPDRACAINAGSETPLLAYLDWSGLRPMTVFEYEKACRGPSFPVPGEFAWGTAIGASLVYGLTNNGTSSEAVATNYNENAGNWWVYTTWPLTITNGPARVGIFAKSSYNGSTSGRIQSGASYYGIMEMTGNLSELIVMAPITYYNSWDVARAGFTGQHGDGQLVSGIANVSDWPTQGIGAYYTRGGGFNSVSPVSLLAVSAGNQNSSVYQTDSYTGIRGVRSAP